MKKIFYLLLLSFLFVSSNRSIAQTADASNGIELDAVLKKGGWSFYLDDGFIIVKKNGYNKGVIGITGQWILEPEIESDSVRTWLSVDNLLGSYIPNESILEYTRSVRYNNQESVYIKLISLNGDVVYSATYKTREEKEKGKKDKILAAINYLLKGNLNLQNLPMTKDFALDGEGHHPNLLKDGYLVFTNGCEGTDYIKYSVIDKTGKIVINKKDDISYYGNNIFYVEEHTNGDRSYFMKIK